MNFDDLKIIEDYVWLKALKSLFEGKMDKAREILKELGFGNNQIKHLNYQLEADDFINQVFDLILDELNADEEALVFEKVQEML